MIVIDEPTANLDFGNRLLAIDRLRSLADEGVAVLFATHEPEQAFAVAGSVVALDTQGRFLTGSPQVVLTSANLTRLYGVALAVAAAPSGRRVVSRAGTDSA